MASSASDALGGRARIGSAGLWVLPSPSGLNANHQLGDLKEMFLELKTASWEG